MNLDRRRFLGLAAGAGALSAAAPLAAADHRQVSREALDRAAAAPVLKLDALESPVVIDSIELVRKGRDYLIRLAKRLLKLHVLKYNNQD